MKGRVVLAVAKRSLRGVYEGLGIGPVRRSLQRSPRRFKSVIDAYMATHPTSGGVTTDDPNIATLIRDGVVVLKDYLDPDLVRELHDGLKPPLERLRSGEAAPQKGDLVYAEDGIYRLGNLPDRLPAAARVIDDPYLRKIAETYLGRLRGAGHYADYKPDLVHDYTTQLHMDSWQSQVKAFVLLSDVGPHNAPFVYWLRSHRDFAWRRRFDYAFWTGDEVGINGLVPAAVLRAARDQSAGGQVGGPQTSGPQPSGPKIVEEVEIGGKAGTVIVADTRGIHRASDLRQGYRLQIVLKYTAPVVL